MSARLLLLIGGLALAVGCAAPPRRPGATETSDAAPRFETWRELRDRNVVVQRYDYSCGAAALTTLLRYYFGDERFDERDVLEAIVSRLSDDELKERIENGFSMLDLKRQAERLGYQAAGVKLDFRALPKLRGPVLVHLAHE